MTDYSNIPAGSQVTGAGINAPGIRSAQGQALHPRHLQLPLRLISGPGGAVVLATLDQDSIEEVTQSVQVLLSTQIGERYRDAPEYGVEELVNGSAATLTIAEDAVATWEPRAAVRFTVDPVSGSGQLYVRVDVALADDSSDVTPVLDR